ncbi:hypothetical protein KVT40_009011 [Elsinoe batatas]|uniref:Uncharacterized protein n=1 Tax=Elsinoe batatas TaxID=2601811 RepID=A0A8K0KVG5_9PEZI|nr:hypothetical protein KVT40_009011 [Elsinoe batatas]
MSKSAGKSKATVQATIYDTPMFAVLYQNSRNAKESHLIAASQYLAKVFKTYGIRFAFVGGWAIRMRGGQRATVDVDVAVDFSSGRVQEALLMQSLIYYPKEIGYGLCIKIFIRVGQSQNAQVVEVDIIKSDQSIQMFGSHVLIISVPRGDAVPLVRLNFQFEAKLGAFFDRGGENDYTDIMWMVTQHQSGRHQITVKPRAENLTYRYRFYQTFYQRIMAQCQHDPKLLQQAQQQTQ